MHQSLYDLSGNFIDEYNPGNSAAAPIMGNSLYAQPGLWWLGPTDVGFAEYKDDMAIIAGPGNGFGYRAQDHGQTVLSANPLNASGSVLSGTGVIAQPTDTDFFSFTNAAAGAVSLSVNVASGPMLHARAQVLDAAGTLLQTAADPSTLGQTLNATLAAGTYYLAVESFGQYGDVGQYTVTGTVQPSGAITLVQSPDHLHIDWTRAPPAARSSSTTPPASRSTATGGNDTITLDYTNGNPLPEHAAPQRHVHDQRPHGHQPAGRHDAGHRPEHRLHQLRRRRGRPGRRDQAVPRQAGTTPAPGTAPPTASAGVITSPAAKNNPLHNTGIGFADFGDGTNVNTMPNTIELKYTLNGDATLNGAVDIFDLNALLAHYNLPGTWTGGDSTYNGAVDIFDLNALARELQHERWCPSRPRNRKCGVRSTSNFLTKRRDRQRCDRRTGSPRTRVVIRNGLPLPPPSPPRTPSPPLTTLIVPRHPMPLGAARAGVID